MSQKVSFRIKKDVEEFYNSRTILYALIRKDLFGKHKNSLLGFGWHFCMPIIMLTIYYITFASGIRASSIDNFIVYLSSGLFLFTYMTSNIINGASCITSNSNMIKKMYFPRSMVILAQTISSFIVMLIGYVVVFSAILIIGYEINILSILLMVVILCLSLVFVTGYCLIFASINVYYRDVQYFLSSVSVVFFFITPMYYTVDSINGSTMSMIVWGNPLTYYVECIHDCIYYGTVPSLSLMCIAIILSTLTLVMGLLVFEKLKHGFAERL